MTCRECRDELELWTGQPALPQDIREHLAGCTECRAYWNELCSLAADLAGDGQIELSEAETVKIEQGINRRLDSAHPTVVTPLGWLRWAAFAASVIIVAGIGFTGYRANWFSQRTAGLDTTVVALADSQSGPATIFDQGDDLDDEDYSILERAIDSTAQLDNASTLDNLSDEQIKYLESHLDVRGLI